MVIRVFILVAIVAACDSGASSAQPHQAPVEITPRATRDAGASSPSTKTAPGAPDGKVLALKDLQQSLGSNAESCEGTARILASQGTVSPDKRAWRERTVATLCRDDRWPQPVRACAATADADPLACTAHLETERQRSHWNGAFEHWLE